MGHARFSVRKNQTNQIKQNPRCTQPPGPNTDHGTHSPSAQQLKKKETTFIACKPCFRGQGKCVLACNSIGARCSCTRALDQSKSIAESV
jgi:hypothetical protein